MKRIFFKLLFLTFYFIRSHAMMIRNDALISKMVSDFQKDNPMADTSRSNEQHKKKPKNVLSKMQNVLCKNFPTVPCEMIVRDETLKNLIQRSIQQLKYKKLSMDKTTTTPTYQLTSFPSINSEDLSNFLQISETGHFNTKKPKKSSKKHKKRLAEINVEMTGGTESKRKLKPKKESTRTTLYGRKKIRKFYPHKIKYKDKSKRRKDYSEEKLGNYSEEKLSMSVEVPDIRTGRKREMMNYKIDSEDPPVWRIDYQKHGEPSFDVFGRESERLNKKLVQTGANLFVSENILE